VTYNSETHRRRSIRLRGYDYSQAGAYFVTICAWKKECLLSGEILNAETRPTEFGQMVIECWHAIPAHFPHAACDKFVVMPNHIHGIVFMVVARHAAPLQTTREQFAKPVSGSLPTIIRSFKSSVTKQINRMRNTPVTPVWQRNYYEHVISDEKELQSIREYIMNNPMQWELDDENPIKLRI
jgi:putative transposase